MPKPRSFSRKSQEGRKRMSERVVCEHGSLERVCLTCDLEAQLAAEKEKNKRLVKEGYEYLRYGYGSEDARRIFRDAIRAAEGEGGKDE